MPRLKGIVVLGLAGVVTFGSLFDGRAKAQEGSDASGTQQDIQPPSAQFVYTSSSVKGNYAVQFSSSNFGGVGSFTADGKGKITGGNLTLNFNGEACPFGISGAYSVRDTGSGSFTFTLTPTDTKCWHALKFTFAAELGQQGASLVLSDNTYDDWLIGSAFLR
jgi:hypothetical protein